MAKSFLVIGLGRFGLATAMALVEAGQEVMVVDSDEELVDSVQNIFMHAVCCDVTDERAIKALGVSEFTAVVIAIGTDLRSSILSTLLCLENGAKYVAAKALDENHVKLLEKIGAHKVIQPEKMAGEKIAKTLVSSRLIDVLEFAHNQSVSEMKVPSAWVDKTIGDINVRHKYKVSIIAVRRGGVVNSYLDATFLFKKDDVLFFIGANADLNRVARLP